MTVDVAGTDLVEQLGGDLTVPDERDDLAVVVKPALPGLRDHLLGNGAQRLGLRLRGGDPLGEDER